MFKEMKIERYVDDTTGGDTNTDKMYPYHPCESLHNKSRAPPLPVNLAAKPKEAARATISMFVAPTTQSLYNAFLISKLRSMSAARPGTFFISRHNTARSDRSPSSFMPDRRAGSLSSHRARIVEWTLPDSPPIYNTHAHKHVLTE